MTGTGSSGAQALHTVLDELANLQPGGVDGDAGPRISEHALDRSRDLINAIPEPGRATAAVFPAEHGGVQFYWPDSTNQLSIDIDPSGALYIHAVDTAAATFQTATIPADTALTDHLTPWLPAPTP